VEYLIVVRGTAMHHLDNVHDAIARGDIFVIPPGSEHSYEVADHAGIQVVNVLFDLAKLNLELRDLEQISGFHALFTEEANKQLEPHLKLDAKDLAYVISVVEEIEEEQEGIEPGWEFFCETKLRELIVFLSRRYSHVTTRGGRNMQRLSGLVDYMDSHLNSRVSFEDLVKVSDMSPTTLRRAFSEAFGCSPMVYLQELRIKKSLILLADRTKSITAISTEVGFNDSGYYARIFKKVTGENPRKFRQRLLF